MSRGLAPALVATCAALVAVVGAVGFVPLEPDFDIAVSGVDVHKTEYHKPSTLVNLGQPGDELYLRCGFTATGSGAPLAIQFRFLVNGQVVDDLQAPVKVGEYVAMGEFWTPPAPGTYTLGCEANPNKTFPETTFANNQQSRQFEVKNLMIDPSMAMKAEALIPSRVSVDVAKEIGIMPDMPDIRVHGLEVHSLGPDNTLQPPTVVTKGVTGREYSLHCVMEPVGQVLSSSVQFLFRVNGKVIRDLHAPVDGTPINVGAKWTPQATGSYQLACEANPQQSFPEATFANNLAQARFPVATAMVSPEAIQALPGPLGRDRKRSSDEKVSEKAIIVCPECFNPQPEPPGEEREVDEACFQWKASLSPAAAAGDTEWQHAGAQRWVTFLESSVTSGLEWAVFEPNAEPVWARVREIIEASLRSQWREGALAGRVAEEAFYARCDRTTMTVREIEAGRLVCLVGVAPSKPAEFVVYRLEREASKCE